MWTGSSTTLVVITQKSRNKFTKVNRNACITSHLIIYQKCLWLPILRQVQIRVCPFLNDHHCISAMQVEQEVACCSKACLLVAQAHIYYSTQRAMFGKCIAYNDGATVEVSWLLLRGKKASPFTGLRPSFPLSFHPSVVVHPLVQYQPMALCRTLWHTLVFEYHETAKYSR